MGGRQNGLAVRKLRSCFFVGSPGGGVVVGRGGMFCSEVLDTVLRRFSRMGSKSNRYALTGCVCRAR